MSPPSKRPSDSQGGPLPLRGRHKRGKRIVQLLQQQQNGMQLQEQQHHHSHPPPALGHHGPPHSDYPQRTRHTHSQQSLPHLPPLHHPPPPSTLTTPSDSSYESWNRSNPNIDVWPVRESRACLLSVTSLTREALDNCIATFFSSIAPVYRLSQPRDLFLSRIRVLLYELAGVDVPNDILHVRAASELLVLAVACLGAPLSSHPYLTQPLYDRCYAITEQPGYLECCNLDTVEAVNLLESAIRVPRPKSSKDYRNGSSSNPLKLDSFGRGFAIELAMYHKLNLLPVSSDKEPDLERRETLFWILWELDAFRMASAAIPCQLTNLNVGWPSPSNAFVDPRLCLARAARQLSTDMLTIRPRTLGIPEPHVASLLTALDSLSYLDNIDWELGTQVLLEQTFLQSTRNLLYLVCWDTAKDQHLPTRTLASAEAAAMGATERMASLASAVTSRSLLRVAPKALRDNFVPFALFLVRKLAEPVDAYRAAHYSTLADTLAYAVGGGRYPDSEQLVDMLREAVYCAREGTDASASPSLKVRSDFRARRKGQEYELALFLAEQDIRGPFLPTP